MMKIKELLDRISKIIWNKDSNSFDLVVLNSKTKRKHKIKKITVENKSFFKKEIQINI